MFEKVMTVVVFGLGFLLITTTAPADTLYVATNGDDSDGADWSSAFTTIQAAVNAALNGDTIIVGSAGSGHGSGVYPETVNITVPVVLESEGGYATTTVGYAGSTDHIIEVPVDVDNVTIRGFSIYGATASGDWQQGGIYLNQADDCTIENNRCGWDVTQRNNFGIYLKSAHNNTIRNNICNHNVYYGIRFWGANDNSVKDNECNDNDSHGIHLYVACNYNLIASNQCNSNAGNGIYVQNSSENTIAYNTCDSNSKYVGLRISNTNYYNAAIGNVLSNSTLDGLFMIEAYNSVIANNRIFGSGRHAIYMSTNAKYGHFYHNNISGNIASEWWAENDWNTPTEMCYLYNPTVKSSMGNYYAGMDYTDTDGDGITDADMDLPGAEHTDEYPLAAEPDQYDVQTWYVNSNANLSQDMAGAPAWVEIAAGQSQIWTTQETAVVDINFAAIDSNDGWTGRVRFDATVTGSDYTVEIGAADPDGTNFSAGPQATLDGSTSIFTFETNGASMTVPAGKALGWRITNNSASTVSVRKGAFSYISAPAGISQAWPGLLPGDIAGSTGVNYVDFAFLAERWNDSNCAANNDCDGADIDGLGDVDVNDLGILSDNWLMGIDQ